MRTEIEFIYSTFVVCSGYFFLSLNFTFKTQNLHNFQIIVIDAENCDYIILSKRFIAVFSYR